MDIEPRNVAEVPAGASAQAEVNADLDLARVEATWQEMNEDQRREAEEFAAAFLTKALRLKGVQIDREQFLKAELHKRGSSDEVIKRALAQNPAAAGIAPATLDAMALAVIEFETRKSTALSFMAGIPGGFAMLGTVPGDIAQFYVHAFRIMQKVSYIYGWQSFLQDVDEIDDETLGLLTAFLGVMMGVGGASASLTAFAANVARPAVQRQIAGVALTKTAWYTPMKQVLRVVGVQVTKDSFAKAASKVVPVIGGVVSGTMTYVMLGVQSRRLMQHLRELPPPGVDAVEYLRLVHEAQQDADSEQGRVAGARERALSTVSGATDYFRAVDLDGDGVADEARAMTAIKGAGTAARGFASGASDRLGSLLQRKRQQRDDQDAPQDEASEK